MTSNWIPITVHSSQRVLIYLIGFQVPIGHVVVIQLDPSHMSQVAESSEFEILDFNVQLSMRLLSNWIPVTGNRSQVTEGTYFIVLGFNIQLNMRRSSN